MVACTLALVQLICLAVSYTFVTSVSARRNIIQQDLPEHLEEPSEMEPVSASQCASMLHGNYPRAPTPSGSIFELAEGEGNPDPDLDVEDQEDLDEYEDEDEVSLFNRDCAQEREDALDEFDKEDDFDHSIMHTEAGIEEHIDERISAGSYAEQACIEEQQAGRRENVISRDVFTKLIFERFKQLGPDFFDSTSGKIVDGMSNSKAVRLASKKFCTPGGCIFKTFPSKEFWKKNSENRWDISDCDLSYMPKSETKWCKELVSWCFPKRLKK